MHLRSRSLSLMSPFRGSGPCWGEQSTFPPLSATQWTTKLKDQQLPGCHAGTEPSCPPNPKFLYGVVLKRPPSSGFPVRHRGATGHFFLSFLLLVSCPPFSPSQQFLNSLSFHISSSEGPLTPLSRFQPPTLLHTSEPTAVFS